MTVRAHRNFGITGGQALTVDTGVVLGQLVRPQAWVELAHICRIRVATSAQLRNLFAINLAFPPRLPAHGLFWIVAGGVTSVATGASQTFLCVYVLSELLLAHSQRIRQGGMTIQAGVLGCPNPKHAASAMKAASPTRRGALNGRSLFRKMAINTHTSYVRESKDCQSSNPPLRSRGLVTFKKWQQQPQQADEPEN